MGLLSVGLNLGTSEMRFCNAIGVLVSERVPVPGSASEYSVPGVDGTSSIGDIDRDLLLSSPARVGGNVESSTSGSLSGKALIARAFPLTSATKLSFVMTLGQGGRRGIELTGGSCGAVSVAVDEDDAGACGRESSLFVRVGKLAWLSLVSIDLITAGNSNFTSCAWKSRQ